MGSNVCTVSRLRVVVSVNSPIKNICLTFEELIKLSIYATSVSADGPEDDNEPVDPQQVETQETASAPKSGEEGAPKLWGYAYIGP